MKIKLEYLDRVYNIGGKNIILRFLEKSRYEKFSKLIPEAFEEEEKTGMHFKESNEKEKFDDSVLIKNIPDYIKTGKIKRKKH